MSEFTMDRLRENLESLKMKHTLEILENYLERAVAENLNIKPSTKAFAFADGGAAPCCAHLLSAEGGQLAHLQAVMYFV